MPTPPAPIAFVLGGGGRLGAAEVGMLEALVHAGVTPDLVVGTSIGAINGAVFAQSPDAAGVERLRELWTGVEGAGLLDDSLLARLRTFRRTRVSLHRGAQLADLIDDVIDADLTFEDLAVPFSCVAARIETASAHWFDRGPLLPALLASSAVPGLFEPVEIDGQHHLDGGLVDSIPLGRAVSAGARTVFVLQVGRIEHPLEPPTNALQVAQVSFEIARRHRFATLMRDLPEDVTVYVLPSGGAAPVPTDLRSNLRYRDTTDLGASIERARAATSALLSDEGIGR